MRKIEELGLEYKTNRWTEDEEALLRELAPKYYIREIAKRFNRTEAAVITKARNMGLKIITSKREFSIDEMNYIKNNWGIIPVTDMARKLQVSRIMIDNQAKKMNLPKEQVFKNIQAGQNCPLPINRRQWPTSCALRNWPVPAAFI